MQARGGCRASLLRATGSQCQTCERSITIPSVGVLFPLVTSSPDHARAPDGRSPGSMSLVLVLDGRAKSRQFMTGLAREAGHRAIAAADAALAADLVREHAADLWLIAANADDPDTAALQRWVSDASIRPRPTVLLYDADGPCGPIELALGLTRQIQHTVTDDIAARAEREARAARNARRWNASSPTRCVPSRPPTPNASS